MQTLSKTDTLFLYMFIVCLQKMLHILDLEILNHKKGKWFFLLATQGDDFLTFSENDFHLL